MTDMRTRLQERMQKKETQKMTELAERSASGQLSTFGGLFAGYALDARDEEQLKQLLEGYAQECSTPEADLIPLMRLTAEVKALNHQAALLHGERIQKVHALLSRYRDGAFTSWLVTVYGNRQTPYNLWRYYELHQALPRPIREQFERLPRQVGYTLATRSITLEAKQEFITTHPTGTKQELLQKLRSAFPLARSDRRAKDVLESAIKEFETALSALERVKPSLTTHQRQRVRFMTLRLLSYLDNDRSHTGCAL